MHRFAFLLAASSFATLAAAQAPTPPVAPPVPEAGQASPIMQPRPANIAPAPL